MLNEKCEQRSNPGLSRYRDKIMARLGVLRNSIDGLHTDNKEVLREYLDSIEANIKCIVESLYSKFKWSFKHLLELDI